MLLSDVFPVIKDNEIVKFYCDGKRIKNRIEIKAKERKK